MHKEWISIHIFYYGDQDFLLVNCIKPLIDDLRERGLIRRYFFIRYWLEGYHIRLRLLPAQGVDNDKVKYIAEQAIGVFLQKRPALYVPRTQQYFSYQKQQFIAEYGKEKWIQTYGEDGTIPLRPNNSMAYIPYEPEYYRYGGVDGVELAEWHFEHSSDVVFKLLERVNVTVQTILLGIAMQVMLPFFYTTFGADEEVISALEYYMRYWQNGHFLYTTEKKMLQSYAQKYQRMHLPLRNRVLQIRQHMIDAMSSEKMTAIEREWITHIRELHQKMNTLLAENKLFTDQDIFVSDENRLSIKRHLLQGSYVHMTNNRLGVSIEREVYLSYLLIQSLKDLVYGYRREGV
jgi:thiopeptide-type bacteriocin biosynthesis protein